MGRAVVGPRADRVGRRPLAAAGGRWVGRSLGARGPAETLRSQGLGWRELESSAAAVSPPDVSFPVDPAPSQNHHQTAWRASSEPDPQPLRMGRARDQEDTALLAPKLQPTSCGNPVAPSVFPAAPAPCQFHVRPRQGEAQRTYLRVGGAGTALEFFKLVAFGENRAVSLSLFFKSPSELSPQNHKLHFLSVKG